MIPRQVVTLVSSGGTPSQLADQRGAPYPTTGYGALVFNTGPHLIDVTLENPSVIGSLGGIAPIDDPIFTGDPQVPTPPPGDNDSSIPNTEWVQSEIDSAIAAISLPAEAFIGDSPPPNPTHGALWWESDAGQAYVFYSDGTSSQWVPFSAAVQGPPGADGATGDTGPPGEQGIQGEPGPPGADGADGTGSGDFMADGSVPMTGTLVAPDADLGMITTEYITGPFIANMFIEAKTGRSITLGINGDGVVRVQPADFSPWFNNTISSGTTANRWANVYSVLGDFSGSVTSAGKQLRPWEQITQAAYDALSPPDANTLYVVVG